MNLMLATVLAFLILTGITFLIHCEIQGPLPFLGRLLHGCTFAPWDLQTFLTSVPPQAEENQCYIFTEQSVSSKQYSLSGRFDQAVLRYGEVRVLEAIIERKFPTGRLPRGAKAEDTFQAGLYSLALMDSGVSCKSAKLIIVYCSQYNASRCGRNEASDCAGCSRPRVFLKRFKSYEVVRTLNRLDEVWNGLRPPRPYPQQTKCFRCPFGESGLCRFSAAQQKTHLGFRHVLGHA